MSRYNEVQETYYLNENTFNGNYYDIKEGLNPYFIQIGENLSWTLEDNHNDKIYFKTQLGTLTGREIVEINYKERNIIVKSGSIEKLIWNSKQLRKNEKNCQEYIENLTDYIKLYLDSDIEKSRINKEIKDKQDEINRLSNLNSRVNNIVSELDTDGNGEVDLVDGESFNKLLNKHQKTISDIDKTYIQKFVKISIYLKTKRKNTQTIFESISESKNESELFELISLLKNQIHSYDLLVYHSISMITSLVESDLITFYEIYESFDQLGVFNSNWENEVSNKLYNIGDGIKDLMYSINRMENNIVNSLETLTYFTEDSFIELNNTITTQLSSIDSSINFNNLLTGIQTYQMYKINQNTKRIN
ncbi:hypothetical protein SKC35_00710 [Aquirufa sp. KTFRIE-69F]|uniref:EF-hand domain-containing protein n=1 Tax=Aquirufa originis TaxID=3096514 RepID=A0ABW6D1W7_9BACT